MLKIEEIKVTNNYILIVLEDKRKFKISEDDYFKEKYRAKDNLTKQQIENLEKISNFHNAYLRALTRLKYKDRSEYEIRQTMYEKFDLIKPEVDKIISKLKRYDFINDKRYIQELVERSQVKYHGYNRIKDDLIKVKINSKLIGEYLLYDEKKELELAKIFAEKSLKSIKNYNHRQTKNKLRSRLLYRGFNNSIITRVIEEIDVPYDEKLERELLKKDFGKIYTRYLKKYEGYQLKSRIFNYLANKGYNYEIINELLEEMENNNE